MSALTIFLSVLLPAAGFVAYTIWIQRRDNNYRPVPFTFQEGPEMAKKLCRNRMKRYYSDPVDLAGADLEFVELLKRFGFDDDWTRDIKRHADDVLNEECVRRQKPK